MKTRRKLRLRLKTWLTALSAVCLTALLLCLSAAAADKLVNITGSKPEYMNDEWGLFLEASNSSSSGNCGTCSVNGNEITLTAKGTWAIIWYTTTTTTLTITNEAAVDVTLTYTVSGEKKSIEISAGGSTDSSANASDFKVTSGNSSDSVSKTIVLTGVQWKEYSCDVTLEKPEWGSLSYKVSESDEYKQVDKEVTVSVSSESGIMLKAEADSGYEFWRYCIEDGRVISDANYTFYPYPMGKCTVSAEFKPTGYAMYTVADSVYCYFDQAVTAAAGTSDKKVILAASGTMYLTNSATTVKIPSGVTFVLPYASGSTLVDSSNVYPYANYTLVETSLNGNSEELKPESSVKYTLTVPENITVELKGMLAVGGTIQSANGVAGATCGAHANLVLNGTLEVGSSGVLSVCGYVLGDGKVVASGGASVYQPFVICDYRGGGYTVGMAGQNELKTRGLFNQPEMEKNVTSRLSPFTRYTMRNIQTELVLDGKSVLYGYCDLYTGDSAGGLIQARHNQCCVAIAGKEGLLVLNSGATLTATYDSAKTAGNYSKIGRTTLKVEGGASFGSMSLTISISSDLSQKVDTSDLVFPLPYNYAITLREGEYTLAYPMKLMPGAALTVDEGATLTVSSTLVIFDELDDKARSDSNNSSVVAEAYYAYPSSDAIKTAFGTPSATLLVSGSGKLILGSGAKLGGVVQTDGVGTPTIVVESGATLEATAQTGGIGSYKFMEVITYYFAGATVRTLQAQLYDASTGAFVEMSSGTTYYGYADDGEKSLSYSYDFYSTADTSSTEKSGTLKGAYQGAWGTLAVYTDSEFSQHGLSVSYRLYDYLWLNATFSLGSVTGNISVSSVVDAEGNDVYGADIVPVNGGKCYYLVCKVLSDQLPDTMTFFVTCTTGGTSYSSGPLSVSFEDYAQECINSETVTDSMNKLLNAMIVYGRASKNCFSGGTETFELSKTDLTDGEKSEYSTLTSIAEYSDALDAHIATKGVNFSFDERITLIYRFQLSLPDNFTDKVVQVGLLVGNPERTLSTEAFTHAYLIYQSSAYTSQSNNTYDGKPVEVSGNTENLDFSNALDVCFDLKSTEYAEQFGLRAFAVLNTGTVEDPVYAVVYGTQYTYGLKNYIARVYNSSSAEFQQFLFAAWTYADAAKEAFS